MKYVTTSSHPELKEGIVFERSGSEFMKAETEGFAYMRRHEIDLQLQCGYIKEVQEPRWTDDDAMALVRMWIFEDHPSRQDSSFDDEIKQVFEKFKQLKNEN